MSKENVFLKGELIYLRKPNIEKDIIEGNWHQWFNDQEITKYLLHGVFPNDMEEQRKIIEPQLSNKNSILLSIVNNKNDKMIGIISLKSIDFINRNAEISIVMGVDKLQGAAIEAMALLTGHAFDRLNLQKLFAGQHHELWKWVNTLETIGYKIEGYKKKMGIRNGQPYDVVLTSITDEDYFRLKHKRNGRLINSFDELYQIKRKENLLPKLSAFLDRLNNEVF